MVLRLADFGPWREVSAKAARALPHAHVLTVVHGDGEDCELAGLAGVRLVNALSYWRSSRPLPRDLIVEDLWFDGVTGWPVTADE